MDKSGWLWKQVQQAVEEVNSWSEDKQKLMKSKFERYDHYMNNCRNEYDPWSPDY